MSLLRLPEELLVMIFRFLDFDSKINVYYTCFRFREVVKIRRAIGHAALTQHIAHIIDIKRSVFTVLAPLIDYLDLSGAVSPVQNHWFKPAIEYFTSIRSINFNTKYVRYAFTLLREIFALYHRLTTVTFIWPIPGIETARCCNDSLAYFFRRFENVHYVGECRDVFSRDPFEVLRMCKYLKELRITALNENYDDVMFDFPDDAVPIPQPLRFFATYVSGYAESAMMEESDVKDIPVIKELIKCKWDHIIVRNVWRRNVEIYMSPRFHEASSNIKHPHMLLHAEKLYMAENDYHVFMWHPSVADANKDFHKDIIVTLARNMPQHLCKESRVPGFRSICDTYFVSPCLFMELECEEVSEDLDGGVSPKRRKTTSAVTIMDIENFVKPGKRVSLTFKHLCDCTPLPKHPLTLPLNTTIFRDVTYLSFHSEIDPLLSSDFITKLLQRCDRLDTLNYECEIQHVLEAVRYSVSLKNVRVYGNIGGSLLYLFAALSNCHTLENIHICDTSNCLNTPKKNRYIYNAVIRNCPNLFSLEHHGRWSRTGLREQASLIKKIIVILGKDIRFEVVLFNADKYRYSVENNKFCCVFLGNKNFFEVKFPVEL